MIMLLAVVWVVVVVVAGGGCASCILFSALFSTFSPAQLLPLLVIYMCLRFRGCPVVLGIELSVSVRYQKTRVLLRVRRLLLLLVAAASGCVRHK